jgi:hypothetical protein
MSDLREVKKYAIGLGIFFFVWVPFISILNSKLGDSTHTSKTVVATTSPSAQELKFQKCQDVRAEGIRLEKNAADLVAKARALQKVWIVGEMTKLRDSGKISREEWTIFSNYLNSSDGVPQAPLGKIIDLMNKVVRLGYIKPYLPANVVDVGSKAALSKSSSDYYVKFPECFSDLENKMYKSLAELPQTKGAWARKLDSPIELIP